MELNVAIVFAALHTSSNLASTFAANNTTLIELGEVHLVHFDRLSWCHNWALHPHTAAMVYPVIESICIWRRSRFQLGFISLNKVAIVLWDIMILLLVLVVF